MKNVIICIIIFAVLLTIAVLLSIYYNSRFQIVSYDLIENKAFLKIVFVSDLHSATYGVKNEKLIRSIEEEHPDLILIGGDMFVKDPEPDMSVAFSFIKEIVKLAPVYYANGNHEKKVMEYWKESKEVFANYKRELEQLGVTYLVNESSTITYQGRTIEIIGLDLELRDYRKIWHKYELKKEEIKKMVPARKSSTDYRILLAHNPRYFRLYQTLDVNLVLSGHVHGGIMILPILGGVIAPDLRLFPKYDFGLFQGGNTKMILSKGLGVHSIKFRIFNIPELTVIQL